jgi:hypothetical protein
MSILVPKVEQAQFVNVRVHLLFQHQGIRQRFDPQGHRSSALLLEEGTLAGALSYRRRQKGVPNLYGIQCVLPLLTSLSLHSLQRLLRETTQERSAQ